MVSFRSLAAAVATGASLVSALNTIEVRNQEFVDTVTGQRLMILGVDYQPGGQAGYKPQDGVDALTDADTCLRDAIVLQNLGVNTIRVYNIDPTLNHDKCMSIFNYAGIYLILDVNSPLVGESIDRSAPWTTYTDAYLERVFRVIEAFKGFPNLLALFAGNEIINDLDTAAFNPQYMRAVQRDMKNYIAKNVDRKIPVGYSAADVREVLHDTWAYLECAIDGKSDDASRADFFGLNSYSWCGGDATFQSAGYDKIVSMFGSSSIPVFYSEYGCNEVKPRVFNEVQALYGPLMTSISGGLVYEYSQEEADYGLVDINDNGTISLRTDFVNLQTQFNKVNLTLIETTNSTATSLTPPECKESLIQSSQFDSNFTLPDTPSKASDMIASGVSGANQGKLVDVTATALPSAVYDVKGAEVTGLVLQSRSAQNMPGGATASSSGNATTTSGSGASASSTKKGAASSVSAMSGVSLTVLVGVFACLFL